MSSAPTENDDAKWLDREYVMQILNSYTNNQLKEVTNFTVGPATAKGENYASTLHLLTTTYTLSTAPDALVHASFIVKSRSENEFIEQISQIETDFNIFQREAQVYTVILAEGHKLLNAIADDTVFGPKVFHVDDRVMVLENLKLRRYEIGNVKSGLNLEQCRLIVEKLAKFHAISMVLYKKNPDMFRFHLPGNISEHPSPLHDLYKNSIRATIDYCKTNPQLEQYVSKLESFGEKVIPKLINVFSRNQTDRFHVLNHGDVWVNNMMFFKETNGSADQYKDVLFVDYQESFYGSPGIDWNYFMFSSWQNDVFANRRDELFELYHSVLIAILHKLNYEQRIPTVEDVKKEVINKGYHGLTTATCLLPILMNEYEELADLPNFFLETEECINNRRTVFNNPKFGERLQLYLGYFIEIGIL